MKTVWKYPLEIVDRQTVALPLGAQIRSVQAQHDNPMLWALVDSDAAPVDRVILTHGTGHALHTGTERLAYLGTFQVLGGSFVGHVFEEIRT